MNYRTQEGSPVRDLSPSVGAAIHCARCPSSPARDLLPSVGAAIHCARCL